MRLPQEAKDMIWKHSIIPRVVRFHRGGSKLGLMYANHDSRTIALKNGYTFLKSERNLNSQERGVPLFGIWVNWDIDIFHLGALFDYYQDSGPIVGNWHLGRRSIRAAIFCERKFKDWMHKVQRMAVDLQDTNMSARVTGEMMEWDDFADLCGQFPALKELMLVADNPKNAVVLFMENTANICSSSFRKNANRGPSLRWSSFFLRGQLGHI
jgi:hypothetical protein